MIRILILLISFNAYANIKDVFVSFTISLSPYVALESKSGIEYDIVMSAFKAAGLKVKGHSKVHYQRGAILLSSKEVDAVVSNASNREYFNHGQKIHGSNMTIEYVDCAITLKTKNIGLETLADFSNKSIWAFKSASRVLGDKFSKAVAKNKKYTEEPMQEKQVKMLSSGRIDVVISDKNIFLARLAIENNGLSKTDFIFCKINPVTPRNVNFYSKELMEKFNKGLEIIKSNGIYKKILSKYKSQYHKKC